MKKAFVDLLLVGAVVAPASTCTKNYYVKRYFNPKYDVQVASYFSNVYNTYAFLTVR